MPQACVDLETIYEYRAKDSSRNAARTIERLLDRAEDIVSFPQSGRVVPEYEQENIREIRVVP